MTGDRTGNLAGRGLASIGPAGIVLAGAVLACVLLAAPSAAPSAPQGLPLPTAPAGAGTAAGPQAASAQPAPAPAGTVPGQRVCRRERPVGSRLRSALVCRAASDWQRLDREGREVGKELVFQPRTNGNMGSNR